MRNCSGCDKDKPEDEFVWTYDRYGNPWKKVCHGCEDKTSNEIASFVFDPTAAGESLEEDY